MARLPTLNPDAVSNDRDSTLLRAAGQGAQGWRVVVLWSGGSTSLSLNHRGRITVGRGRGCGIQIDHASVSREHAALVVTEDVEIEDLESKNGTVVNGRRLTRGERVRLGAGTVAEVGDAMLILHGSVAPDDHRPTVQTKVVRSDSPPSMEQTNRLIELVGKSSISVILAGETGVGKEVLAERIHRLSPRADNAFVGLNCAALPDSLLESELFGYERGAFTGAVQTKMGLLETASGGTVFLDELGEMPVATQAKLLRAIENREALRVGGTKPRPFDVRFIAATNRDLEGLVMAGSFRTDLYFRLNGISIQVPPLRARPSEIEPLAKTFLAEACKRAKRGLPLLSPEALTLLKEHRWPGNVRELRNVVDRAVLLCQGDVLGPEHVVIQRLPLPDELKPAADVPSREAATTGSLPQELAAIERQRIIDALERCGGNQKKAAEALGISRRTLVYRLDAHGIARPRKGGRT